MAKKSFIARVGFVDRRGHVGIKKVSPEDLQIRASFSMTEKENYTLVFTPNKLMCFGNS